MDYKDTVFLPKTDFGLRANLSEKEPQILDKWAQKNLWQQIKERNVGKEKFTLHDGPPYANGNLHMGHALNKILKDIVNRTRAMQGYDIDYVPGWDCHGLPIEWKIEEKYKKAKKNKDDVPTKEFRQECRDFAQHWVGIQTDEFQRLGVMGDWDSPYLTMTFKNESAIVSEILKFLMNGALYKGVRPVMWSVVEKTALADAEVEYKDHKSDTIYVKFPIVETKKESLKGVNVVIWTTTPWTIPGNRAVAYGEEIDYCVVEIQEKSEESIVTIGDKIILAKALIEKVTEEIGITKHAITEHFTGADLAGTICAHPFRGHGYDFDIPALSADFVTTDQGTGIVHIAPGHGADDFLLGKENNIEIPQTVGDDGLYYEHVPMFAGHHVYKANTPVCEELSALGMLAHQGSLMHSYPHSWRSKAPLIFRTTPQWFISMENTGLRETALSEIDKTEFVPEGGRNRLRSMVEQRPDWCISRQRAWGVPIALFVHKETGEPLKDEAINQRIIDIFAKEGCDCWFTEGAEYFLGDAYDANDYEMSKDIVDVWFESGSTHAFVIEDREPDRTPISLYLEGSDQHRGWFQSSLLESCGTRGHAPYTSVLTHGFVMDGKGYKMSKSMGNVVSPQDVLKKYGADIMRLWVVGSDYSEDLRVGDEILKQHADKYRRIRNTLRYLLGALNDYKPNDEINLDQMPELEKWVLHQTYTLNQNLEKWAQEYNFHSYITAVHDFCSGPLSSIYFDIRKDTLYCDALDNVKRQSALAVMNIVFDCLTKWLAPILCFTAEEAWSHRHGQDASIHLQDMPNLSESFKNDVINDKWQCVFDVRKRAMEVLEEMRSEKHIKSGLEASLEIGLPSDFMQMLEDVPFAEVCIVSTANISKIDGEANFSVTATKANGQKCERCWNILEEVGTLQSHSTLCHRCGDAVDKLSA